MGSNISCLISLGVLPTLPFDHDILEVKSQRDDLLQYREELERQTGVLKTKLLEFVKNGDKKRAKYTYCNKRINEKLLALADSCILEILNLLSDIEHKKIRRNVVGTITSGVNTIKKINQSISCQWIMEDDYKVVTTLLNEMPELFNEISIYIESDDFDLEELIQVTPTQSKNTTNTSFRDTSPSTSPYQMLH